ncbi:MAG: hypothetical protein IT164_02090 [Bryobacterales bacterium]|nr:hypothetical protein [Bryobacterales bacterium]
MTLTRAILAGAAGALIVLSCGPFFADAVFTYESFPQFPDGEYVSGKLGIVAPGYWRKYLVVAWRTLDGKPLTAVERRAFERAKGEPAPPEPRDPWSGVGVEREVPGGQYQSFLNCPDDAFRRAREKLAEITKQYGASSAAVKSWRAAQDTVFSNCAEGEHIPAPPEAGLPAPVARERRYQIAAANFYAMKYEVAEREFRALGEPYLAVRCLIRRGTIGPQDNAVLRRAETELRKLGGQPLLGFLASRLRPAEYRAELAGRLNDPKQEEIFARSLTDYTWLLDRENATFTGDEMTEWIAAVQSGEGDAAARWRQSRKPAWLVAALMHAKPGGAANAELLEAARGVPSGSPAYATTRFHRVRLLLADKDTATARQELDAALALSGLPLSAQNAFRKQRLTVARDYGDWIAFAPRTPLASTWEMESAAEPIEKPVPLFDGDAAAAANRGLPLSVLRRAAADPKLPANLRAQLANAVRTREILFSGGGYDEIYTLLKTPAQRPYVIAGIDRRPETPSEIDEYRANWWCAWDEHDLIATQPWLTAAGRAEANKELAALRAMPSAPTWLARRAVQLVAAAPKDARNAELLHLAVRSTRYGCTDDSTTAASKAAFQTLHRLYPNSDWAKKTKYYF